MIPKVIHYCWIGKVPLPKLARKCIASWEKIMPDYEIKLWNEDNYDFKKNEFMKNAYMQQKWGFVPDYARLDIIYNYGGIYLDTDVEVLKPFDEFLKYPAFCGFESKYFVAFGLGFGAEKGNNLIKEMLDQYETLTFDLDEETKKYFNTDRIKEIEENKIFTPSPILQTQFLRNNYGLKQDNTRQSLKNIEVFPTDFFCPRDEVKLPTITEKAFSVHWYMASWVSKKQKIKIIIRALLIKFLGKKVFTFLYKIYKK